MITKTLEPTNDVKISFTEEEMSELNIKPDDKFEVIPQEDGSIRLERYVDMELNLEEFPIETLWYLIKESCQRDVSVNEIINSALKRGLKDGL